MKKIIEVLRLKYEARLSHAKIAQVCGLSKGVVGKYVSATQGLGLTWPLAVGVDEARLEALLFPTRHASRRGAWSSRTSLRCTRRSSARA